MMNLLLIYLFPLEMMTLIYLLFTYLFTCDKWWLPYPSFVYFPHKWWLCNSSLFTSLCVGGSSGCWPWLHLLEGHRHTIYLWCFISHLFTGCAAGVGGFFALSQLLDHVKVPLCAADLMAAQCRTMWQSFMLFWRCYCLLNRVSVWWNLRLFFICHRESAWALWGHNNHPLISQHNKTITERRRIISMKWL